MKVIEASQQWHKEDLKKHGRERIVQVEWSPMIGFIWWIEKNGDFQVWKANCDCSD